MIHRLHVAPRPVAACLLVVAALAVAGCAEQEPVRLTVQPVRGQVLVDGKPAARVQITFHPLRLTASDQDQAGTRPVRPIAVSQQDGSYAPTTYFAGDGLPPGEYALTAVCYRLLEEGGEEVEGPDIFSKKYSSVSRPVQTVTVTEGLAELPPLELRTR